MKQLEEHELVTYIEDLVRKFYLLAINDVFIGYHFRKIIKDFDDRQNINSNLGHFEDHIPKVVDFWASQMIPAYKPRLQRPHVFKVHEYLNIHFGEIGRWATLFKQTLEAEKILITKDCDNEFKLDFLERWQMKVDQFVDQFKKYFFSKN